MTHDETARTKRAPRWWGLQYMLVAVIAAFAVAAVVNASTQAINDRFEKLNKYLKAK